METIGTTGTKIDLDNLDSVTNLFQEKGALPELDRLLQDFVDREDLFLYTEEVLMSKCNSLSKFFFLKGLTSLISTKWPVIPDDSKDKNREVIISFIGKPYDSSNQNVLNKAFAALTEILKFDLDQNWPNFFETFFSFSSNSPINGLLFLTYFTKEIMSDSEQVLTSNRASEIMAICTNQVDNILEFTNSMLQENITDKVLIKTVLPVFSILIQWLSPDTIFESPIFDLITSTLINDQEFAFESCEVLINSLNCLQATSSYPEFIANISQIFTMAIETLHNLCEGEYLNFPSRIQTLFLTMMEKCTTCFSEILNQASNLEQIQCAYTWLMQLTLDSTIEPSILEMCFVVWLNTYNKIGRFYQEAQNVFQQFMAPLRRAIIANFPQPYKIVTYIDDFNNETKIYQNQLFTNNLCSMVRDCFLFLTNSGTGDTEDTLNAINERFEQGDELTVEDIQKLGYAISATSGSFKQTIEDTVIFEIIQKYFALCQSQNPNIDSTEGGRMKVACSLIYMCSQYFSILNRFDTLLKAVLQLIMKFLVEGDFELQAVSIYALKTLSQRCRLSAAFPQEKEGQDPFLNLLLENSDQIFNAMEPDNVVELLRVFGILIRSNKDEQAISNYIQQLMSGINKMWEDTVMSSSFDPFDVQQLHIIDLTMMCNSSILLSIPMSYAEVLKDILPQLITVMQNLSQAMSSAESEEVLNAIKSAKSQILQIIFRFTYLCHKKDLIIEMVIPASFQPILEDYINAEPQFRVRMSLKYFKAVFNCCSSLINDLAFSAYDLIMEATLPAILQNNTDFIEIRSEFFEVTACIVHQYSSILASKESDYINNFIKTLKFGAEHPNQSICENCIELISDLFMNFKNEMNPPERFGDFFDNYFSDIVQLYFHLLTDFTYKFAFKQLTMSIKNIFVIENMRDKASEVFELVCSMFSTVPPKIIKELIQSLLSDQAFDYANSRVKLRDFVLTFKVVMPNDPNIYEYEITEMKKELKESFKEIVPEAPKEEENDEIILQDLKVAPSPQIIQDLASMSIRDKE